MEAFFLRTEIITWGMCLLIVIPVFIYCFYSTIKEKSISSFFAGIFWILIFGSIPAWGFYITMNKYCSKPKPTIIMETCKDGEIYMMYQDTTHLCHPSDNNSTVFTSYMPPTGAVSQMDTCIICLRPFLAHDTHAEHRFFDAMSKGTEAYYNSISADLVKKTNIQSFYEVNDIMTCWNNVRRIEFLHPKKCIARLIFYNFAFQNLITSRLKMYYHE